MTRDEIACQLIAAELSSPNAMVRLTNPRPLSWTTLPPPAIYVLVENALWIADSLLAPKREKAEGR